MNREIKFRAWDNSVNQMYYDNPIIRGFSVLKYEKDIKPMQYTGLKDKNGKDIYEGDYVKCLGAPSGSKKGYYEMIGRIDQDRFGWTVAVWHKKEWWGYGKMNYSSLEIIGNIYEHPHLLQK